MELHKLRIGADDDKTNKRWTKSLIQQIRIEFKVYVIAQKAILWFCSSRRYFSAMPSPLSCWTLSCCISINLCKFSCRLSFYLLSCSWFSASFCWLMRLFLSICCKRVALFWRRADFFCSNWFLSNASFCLCFSTAFRKTSLFSFALSFSIWSLNRNCCFLA